MFKGLLRGVIVIVWCWSTQAQAKDFGPELLSACAVNGLAQCKMVGKHLSASELQTYSKLFSCIRNGSTTGDTFSVGIPIPDVGMFGFDVGNNAVYSSEVCKEEVKKFNNTEFLQTYNETFSGECGRTAGGQYKQCLAAAKSLVEAGNPQVQSLTCAAAQSERQIVINTRYIPAAMESPANYKIESVGGVDGLNCRPNAYPGVGQYGSLVCTLPAQYQESSLVVTLANSVSCSVPVKAERRFEVSIAKRNSCAAIFQSVEATREIFGSLPNLMKISAVGLCDVCVAQNLATSSDDQRTLTSRTSGCVVWALSSMAEAKAQVCTVVPEQATATAPAGTAHPVTAPATGLSAPIGGFGNPFVITPVPAPGTRFGTNGILAQATANELAAINGMCAGRGIGEVLQLQGDKWKNIPIDYLNSSAGQNPVVRDMIRDVEAAMAQQ